MENNNSRKNLYTVGLEETNGEYRIISANKLQPINQHRSVFRKTNARDLARNIKRGNLVTR